jgi:hypothetical protein
MPNIFELSYNVCGIISFTLSSPFWLDSVKFSGHTISKDGISVDRSKVQEVMDWKSRKSVHQIRSFLGLAGYYRRFISDFSRIAKPMCCGESRSFRSRTIKGRQKH